MVWPPDRLAAPKGMANATEKVEILRSGKMQSIKGILIARPTINTSLAILLSSLHLVCGAFISYTQPSLAIVNLYG